MRRNGQKIHVEANLLDLWDGTGRSKYNHLDHLHGCAIGLAVA